MIPRRRRTLLCGAAATGRAIGVALAGAAPDLLLVFYSGALRVDPTHPPDPLYLLTADGDPVHDLSLRRLIDSCVARALVLFLDVLLVGDVDAARAAAGLTALTPSTAAPPTGYAMLAACSHSPTIKESPWGRLGAFTATLVRGLADHTAIRQYRGELRVAPLAQYVGAHLLDITNQPPLLCHTVYGQAPLLARRATPRSRAGLRANDRAEPGSSFRCSRCGRSAHLGGLYLCDRCGELYCTTCVGQREPAGSPRRRCACGGQVI